MALILHVLDRAFRVGDDFKEAEHPRDKGGKFTSVHFKKELEPSSSHINGVELKSWTPPKNWENVPGQQHSVEPETGGHTSSGVIMREKDGRVWLVKPTNSYGGYNYTFPKGGLEKGLHSQANAIKEAYEESGLKAKIVGHAGDYKGTTGSTRYYWAEREGGHPHDHGWESEAVVLIPPNRLHRYLNMPRDIKIMEDLFGKKE
jgi:8-oxo-dGTP pyrophosphatase MutT (NUDIX family)